MGGILCLLISALPLTFAWGLGNGLLINVVSVADSQYQDFLTNDRKNDPVVAYAAFSQTGERALERRAGFGILGKLFLDPGQDSRRSRLGCFFQVAPNRPFIDDVTSQGIFSGLFPK